MPFFNVHGRTFFNLTQEDTMVNVTLVLLIVLLLVVVAATIAVIVVTQMKKKSSGGAGAGAGAGAASSPTPIATAVTTPPPTSSPITNKVTRVQLCNPWLARDCPYSGTQLTCKEFWDCYKNNGQSPCAGDAWFEKCGYAGDEKGIKADQ